MKFKADVLDILSGRRSLIVNVQDAERAGLLLNDRVTLTYGDKQITGIVELSNSLVGSGSVGLYRDVAEKLGIGSGEEVELSLAPTPKSVNYIRKKVRGKPLTAEEIKTIVKDVVSLNLSDLEIASFLFANHYYGLSMDEVEALTRAMVETGERMELPGRTVDKHSIGGVPGNKISLLIVPIIASTELLIPKTSSKAITSPSGTADTMSVLADVKFSLEEVKEIVLKAHGCIVWGGALNVAPADDLFIRVEYPLRIDPEGQMLASIMAKKVAVGAQHLVLDIPVGRGAKVPNIKEGEGLAQKFIELGRRLGMDVKVGITYGGQPIGRAIGPALEAKEALEALLNPDRASKSLIEKSVSLAGLLLETSGMAFKGKGREMAKDMLFSGKALEKLREIIELQGGKRGIMPDEIPIGQHSHKLTSPADGYVTLVDNTAIADIARAAGAPLEKGAGILLHAKQGHKVSKGDVLMEIFAERSSKLSQAVKVAESTNPIVVEGMLLKSLPEF